MTSPRDDLQSMWGEANRWPNFGDAVVKVTLEGIRCHRLTTISVASPITALCGLNGTGKSTILQMLAVAYKNSEAPSYRVGDFIISSALDPAPYSHVSSINYQFWDDAQRPRSLTISYNDRASRWYGYDRRRERAVFFAGVGLYLPRVEKRDFLIRHATRLTVQDSLRVDHTITDWTCRVLGHSYDDIRSNTVIHERSRKTVCSLTRQGRTYSEMHMGFGEGRAQFLIRQIESLEPKSLVLLEEPETSLHQRAQHAFGQYLINSCLRKGHQIFLTTHSQYLLNALHSASRVFLYQSESGVEALRGIAASQANSLLTEGYDKSLTVIVEDECAAILLAEIMRHFDETFLRTIAIVPGGSSNDIRHAARALRAAPVRVVAVRDGDKGSDPRHFIYKLPGALPPEKELLFSAPVQARVETDYGVIVRDFLAANPDLNHHDWFKKLGERCSVSESTLIAEAAREYVMKALPENEARALSDQLKDAASR